jgi:hypothetical protein
LRRPPVTATRDAVQFGPGPKIGYYDLQELRQAVEASRTSGEEREVTLFVTVASS